MNWIISNYYPVFKLYQALREQLMELLVDEDLAYRVSEGNPTLGALCREMGEVERAYIDSFRTFKQDFSYRNLEPGLEGSVSKLVKWYEELDDELRSTLEALSQDDVDNRPIDRGDFTLPPKYQIEVYKEALLIFYGKVSVYLKAMGKSLPEQWQNWIG